MISKFYASGFKSLKNFSMDIRPGLNVLVGPNGSGKTNIIEALEFFSQLSQRTVGEAIGQLGGVGRIISKVSDDQYAENVEFRVEGERLISSERYVNPTPSEIEAQVSLRGVRSAKYAYSVDVRIERDRVHVAKEDIKVWLRRVRRVAETVQAVQPRREIAPDFVAERVVRVGEAPIVRHKSNSAAARFGQDYYRRAFFSGLSESGYSRSDTDGERTLLAHARRTMGGLLLGKLLPDLTFGSPFNVVPDRVREPMDIAAQPAIQKDGFGFAATLWSMQKAQQDLRRIDNSSVDRLVAYARRANPRIQGIEAYLDAWESKIGVFCWLGDSEDRQVKMPLSALSDGTLKWLALVAAVVTRKSMFAVEEPENFVHPAVQKTFIEILRERFDNKADATGFAFLSTHSETLINALEPEEIAIVSMKDGKTDLSRLLDVKLVASEIERTGFGLGHYYLMGALDE